MSQLYPPRSARSGSPSGAQSQASANTLAVANAISARAGRVQEDLKALSRLEQTRPLTRQEQDRADWLRWLSNRLAIELTTLRQELALHASRSTSAP